MRSRWGWAASIAVERDVSVYSRHSGELEWGYCYHSNKCLLLLITSTNPSQLQSKCVARNAWLYVLIEEWYISNMPASLSLGVSYLEVRICSRTDHTHTLGLLVLEVQYNMYSTRFEQQLPLTTIKIKYSLFIGNAFVMLRVTLSYNKVLWTSVKRQDMLRFS